MLVILSRQDIQQQHLCVLNFYTKNTKKSHLGLDILGI